MNLAQILLGAGALVIWGNGYTYGNWIGNNWSGGQPHADGDPLDESVDSVDEVDEAGKNHDISYNNAYLAHAAGTISGEEKKARERDADRVLREELAAIDPETLSPQAGRARDLARLYYGMKDFFESLGAPTPESENGLYGPTSALEDGVLDPMEAAFDEAEGASPDLPCPLVLDLDGDGTGSVALSGNAYFDHAADGFAEATGWADVSDGILVMDRNLNNRIDSGRELFGNQTLLQSGQLAANGFAALAEWDGNSDGKIDAADSVWGNLQIWQDVDGDGVSAADELLSMSEAGVLSINLAYSAGSGVDANGNEVWLTGSFTRTDATSGEVTDYRFATNTVRSIAREWIEVPAAIALLPDARGFGKVYDLRQAMVRDSSGALQGLVEDFAAEGTVAERNALIDQILLTWANAEGVDPASRGTNIDARRLVALEAFMGRGFVGVGGSANPNANAATQLNTAYTNLLESVYAQLMAQTHLSGLYAQISYNWDANSESLVGDLEATKASLVANIVGGDGSALLAGAEFVRTVRGMGAEDTLDLDSFQNNPALAGLLNAPFGVNAGGATNDTLSSGAQMDLILGMAGDDSISTSGSNDIVHGGDGNDTITLQSTGSYGRGTAHGGAGNDTITVASTHSLMQYEAHTISGGSGDDVIYGSIGNDTYLYGRGDGADTITENLLGGSATTDKIVFGAGIALTDVNARRVGNDMELRVTDPGNPAADDRITVKNWYSGVASRIELLQFADNATLTLAQLEAQAAIITGTESNDSLVGFSGHETYYGMGGNDTIQSGGGNDVVYGGAGDDTITDTSGADTIYGEDGNDSITLQAGGSYGGGTAHGGGGNDTITIASTGYSMQFQSLTISGGTGNDILNGSVGYDTYLYGRGDGADTITENLLGGSAATDKIVFGAGIALADVAARRVVNDMELRVTDPGNPAADDRITIKNWYSGVASRIELLQFADNSTLTAAQMEAQAAIITGTEGNDILVGFSGSETYYGLGGNDTIQSGGGNDTVYGGAGDDTITDTSGADTVYGEDGNDSITLQTGGSYGGGTAYGGAGNDTITIASTAYSMQFQSLTISGGTGNDILNGSVGYDTYLYNRGDGADTITENLLGGSAATDRIVFGTGIAVGDVAARRVGNDMELRVTDPGNPAADDRITVKNWYSNANGKIEQLQFVGGATLTIAQLEAQAAIITGTEGNDSLVGFSGSETYYGLGGNDGIQSGNGNDTVYGGAGNDSISDTGGNDTVYGEDGDDVITLQANSASSGGGTAYGGAGNDTISIASTAYGMQFQSLTISGGTGNDILNGSVGYDTYLYGRGDGVDTITENLLGGSAATDKIVFGAGIALADVSARRVVNDMELRVTDLGNPGADDRITIKNWFSNTLAKIELLQFADASTLTLAQLEAQAAIITGTEGNDSIVGYSGNETYQGLGGNDSIQSGWGNDLVYGGAGNDTISDLGGNDTIYGEDGDDAITLHAHSSSSGGGAAHGGTGNDTITIASLAYGMQFQSLTISGGTGNDIIVGSVGYDTYLYGRADGADTITENLLGGSSATDKIVFGAGIALADVAARRVGNDMELRVTDPGNPAADDRITIKNWYLSASYRIERLDFSDGTFVLGTNIIAGNETANTLTGTTGVDLLGGGAGNDVISGGAGSDVAHGGDGDDTVSGEDGSDFLYGDAGNDGLTGGAGNDYVAGGTGNDSIDGGIGNDVLQGENGEDQVQGGDGNDLVAAGSGADVLNGGDGNDLLAGGAGDDTIHTGTGSNVISYNAGDGIDTVHSVSGASNTLSFGGGVDYDDLSLSKDGNDLVVSAGANDRVVLKDWYAGSATVFNLQIILDASAAFDANSSDPLYNKRVQTFDFAGLVSEFDDALAQSPGLTSWAVTNALLAFHLAGSDDAAIGGDLAYWYGKNNSFGGIGLAAAQQVIDGTGFGSDAQTLRPFSGLQEGLVKLS